MSATAPGEGPDPAAALQLSDPPVPSRLERIESLSRHCTSFTFSLVLAMLAGMAAGWVLGYGLIVTAPPVEDPALYRVATLAELPFAVTAPAGLFVGVLLGYWLGIAWGAFLMTIELMQPRVKEVAFFGAAGAALLGVFFLWCDSAPVWSLLSLLAFVVLCTAGYAAPRLLRGERLFTFRPTDRVQDRAAVPLVLTVFLLLTMVGPAMGGAWEEDLAAGGAPATEAMPREAARFRDRWLLGGGVGTALSDFYYRYTPYAAASIPADRPLAARPGTLWGLGYLKGVFWSWGHLGWAWLAAFVFLAYGPAVRLFGGSRRAVVAAAATLALALAATWIVRVRDPRAARIQEALTRMEKTARILSHQLPYLREFLTHEEADVRYEAYSAIAQLPDESCLDPFLRGLKDADARVRFWSADGLGKLRSPDAIGPLADLLKDPSLNVRYKAAEALGEIGGPRAVAPLEALRDGDDLLYVRDKAVQALRHATPGGTK